MHSSLSISFPGLYPLVVKRTPCVTTKNGAIWSQCSAAGEGTGRKSAELSLGENHGCKSYEKTVLEKPLSSMEQLRVT